MGNNMNKSILSATKWSTITELIAKLIVPVTNMVLARILVPEVFGIVATVNMVVSFCDTFTTAGFQKYLVQHQYNTDEELGQGASVAFWTNIVLSLSLWLLLIVFRNPIAVLVGNPGYGAAIAVAGASLPITSFSSIQIALFQRRLEYKTLFYTRLSGILTPLVVTVPLALLGLSFWSLIIGSVAGYAVQALVITLRSTWKPNFFYRFSLLRHMLSFSVWTLLETYALWLCSWVDIFIIGNAMDDYYTGLYKTGQTTVIGILTIVTSALTSVLFSSLSKVQDDDEQFEQVMIGFQKIAAMFILPMGAGILIYRNLITYILLGEQWMEAATFVGVWGFCTAIVAVYGTYSREAYRAKGKPKIALVVQLIQLMVIVPACLYGVDKGFSTLIFVRAIAHVIIVPIHMVFMKWSIGFRISKMYTTTVPCMIATCVMAMVALIMRNLLPDVVVMEWIGIGVCIVVYFGSLLCFPSYKSLLWDTMMSKLRKRP